MELPRKASADRTAEEVIDALGLKEATDIITNGQVVKPSVRIQTITPAQAEKILADQNVRNRDLRETRVTQLAGIIDRGEWRLTGDAICFDLDGVLLNGQHRLAGCVAADKPIEVVVLRNLPRANQDVMDNTLTRRLGDALKLRGEVDVHRLGAGINWYARLCYIEATGSVFYANNAMRPSIPQLLTFYGDNPGLRDASAESVQVGKALTLRPGALIALWYRFGLIDPAHRDLFFESLRTGADLPLSSPILKLRRYCENERLDRTRRRGSPDWQWVAITIKAWNYWRESRPVHSALTFHYGPVQKDNWPIPL